MEAFTGKTVKFKQGTSDVMEVYSVEGERLLLGEIKLGDNPYILRTKQKRTVFIEAAC